MSIAFQHFQHKDIFVHCSNCKKSIINRKLFPENGINILWFTNNKEIKVRVIMTNFLGSFQLNSLDNVGHRIYNRHKL